MKEHYLQKQNSPYFKDQFDVKPYLYLHFERKFRLPDFIKKGNLHSNSRPYEQNSRCRLPI